MNGDDLLKQLVASSGVLQRLHREALDMDRPDVAAEIRCAADGLAIAVGRLCARKAKVAS